MNKIMVSTLCLWGLMGLTACGETGGNSTASSATNNSNSAPATGKVYRVGSELSKFPVVVHDGNRGVSGFEAELLTAVAEKQGFKVEYTMDNWAGLLNKLQSNQADMIIGSITITDERRKSMDFTESVLPYQTGVMVNESLANVKSFRELRGKKVNLRKNTVYEALVPTFQNASGDNMVYPETVWGQVKSLMSGESEAMVGASITLEYYKNQYPDKKFHIIYEPNTPTSHYGWAVQKGNAELLNQLNTGLEKVKQDGTYAKLHQKYWGNAASAPNQ